MSNNLTGNKKRATSLAALQKNELNRNTAHEKKPCNLICCQTGSNVCGKTHRYSSRFAATLQTKLNFLLLNLRPN